MSVKDITPIFGLSQKKLCEGKHDASSFIFSFVFLEMKLKQTSNDPDVQKQLILAWGVLRSLTYPLALRVFLIVI